MQMAPNHYYLSVIKERLSQKQKLNPHYSLRAYARDLEVHPSTLSQIISGSRALPLKDSKRVVEKLGLSPKERTLFLESLFQTKTKIDQIEIDLNDERIILDESFFKVIAEWEHYAVLTLFDLDGFQVSVHSIADRLNITSMRAEVVLMHLEQIGFIKKSAETNLYEKCTPRLRTTEDISSSALQKSHRETLEMGLKKLDETEVDFRDYSSMNVAIDLKKMTEAKTIIREFRQKMAALLRDGEKTEVYQLAIQFYPITKLKPKQEN